ERARRRVLLVHGRAGAVHGDAPAGRRHPVRSGGQQLEGDPDLRPQPSAHPPRPAPEGVLARRSPRRELAARAKVWRRRTVSSLDAFDLDAWLAALVATGQPPPIVQAGAAVLRRRARDVPAERLGTPGLQQLVEIMVDVMRAAPGVGLAAPQIGVPLRIFVAEDAAERLARVPPASLG